MSAPTDDQVPRPEAEADGPRTDPGLPTAARGGGDGGSGGDGGKGNGMLIIGIAAALVATVTFIVMNSTMGPGPQGPQNTAKGPTTGPTDHSGLPDVDLSLFVARDGTAVPLSPGEHVAPGEHILFEISAEAPAPVRVWVEPDGMPPEDLGTVDADPTPAMVTEEGGMMAWGFGTTRTAIFHASAARGGCPPESCASWVVTSRVPEPAGE